jgi:hypothetical protein
MFHCLKEQRAVLQIHQSLQSSSATLLLLGTKSRRANITSPELNTQNLLHRSQDLLIWGRRSTLEIRYDTLCGVALGRQIFLRHLGLHLLSLLGDGITDLLSDRVGLDNVVAAINFSEMLAFNARFRCL